MISIAHFPNSETATEIHAKIRVKIDRNRYEPLRNATGKGKMAVKKIKASDAGKGKKLYLEGHFLAEVCRQLFFDFF